MVTFTPNTTRLDPYKGYKFLIKLGTNTTPVAGVSKVGGLKRSTEVVEWRAGGDLTVSKRSPGRTKYEPITLERGLTMDVTFEQWANKAAYYPQGFGSEVSLGDYRQNLTIVLCNEAGQPVMQYFVYNCWVSEWQALPELDSNGQGSIAIQSIKLEHDGWQRDMSLAAPTEPVFTEPSG